MQNLTNKVWIPYGTFFRKKNWGLWLSMCPMYAVRHIVQWKFSIISLHKTKDPHDFVIPWNKGLIYHLITSKGWGFLLSAWKQILWYHGISGRGQHPRNKTETRLVIREQSQCSKATVQLILWIVNLISHYKLSRSWGEFLFFGWIWLLLK